MRALACVDEICFVSPAAVYMQTAGCVKVNEYRALKAFALSLIKTFFRRLVMELVGELNVKKM